MTKNCTKIDRKLTKIDQKIKWALLNLLSDFLDSDSTFTSRKAENSRLIINNSFVKRKFWAISSVVREMVSSFWSESLVLLSEFMSCCKMEVNGLQIFGHKRGTLTCVFLSILLGMQKPAAKTHWRVPICANFQMYSPQLFGERLCANSIPTSFFPP